MFGLLKNLFGNKALDEFIAKKALIIDVRSASEYNSGHIKGSLNIPLDKIANQVEQIRKKNQPVITCCLSGGRSGRAAEILRSKGIEVVNGGPWSSLERKLKG